MTTKGIFDGWIVEKKIPLPALAVIFVAVIGFFLTIDRMDNRIATLEKWQTSYERIIARLPSELNHIQYSLRRMEAKLDKEG